VVAKTSVTDPSDSVTEAPRPPRLDGGTQLVNGCVGVNWWPSAGEAVAFLAVEPLPDDVTADRRDERLRLRESMTEEQRQADELARVAENGARAARRAKSRVRRYVVANVLTRIVTLTFAPDTESSPGRWSTGGSPVGAKVVHGPGDDGACQGCGRPYGLDGVRLAMRRGAAAIRALRVGLGTTSMPYVLVPEFHADDHVHLHLMLDRCPPEDVLQAAWPWGFFDDGERSGRKVKADGGGREAARKAARYATKYVTKAFAEGVDGRHRYEVGQGWQPAVVKRGGFRSLEQAVAFVEDHGQLVTYAVHSEALDDYEGPPFLWVALNDG
jgi:hypothetical protein